MDQVNLDHEPLKYGRVALAVTGLILLVIAAASGLVPALTLAQAPTTPTGAGSADARAWIENPLAGQTLPLAPVGLVVYATDLQGVARIELRINGELLPAGSGQEEAIDPKRHLLRLDQEWTPSKEGKYILEGRGVNTAGGYGEPDFVEFCVGTCQGAVVQPTATSVPSPSPTTVPLRVTFTVDRSQLPAGGCVVLEWKVEGRATSIKLNGQDVPGFAKTEVCPPRTTKYTLVVTGADGEVLTREITVVVEQPDTPTPRPAPVQTFTPTSIPILQVTFTANPTNIVEGQCALLQWAVQGNPTLVTLNGQAVPAMGQSQVCPPQTTTYTLLANITGGAPVERTITIAVTRIPPSPTSPPPQADIRFWADEDNVRAGSCTTIRWHVTGIQAYWVDGQPGMGDDGSLQVCPCQTETHTLHVVKADGSQQDFYVTIQVRGVCVTPTSTPGHIIIPPDLLPIAPIPPGLFIVPTATPIPPIIK